MMIVWLCCLFTCTAQFQFKSLSVNPVSTQINILTSYTFQALRNLDNSLQSTPWNTQLVPLGSNIVINFPTNYLLTGIVCSSVLINNIPITNFQTQIITSAIVVTNCFPAASAVQIVNLELSNILNPTPTLNIYNFTMQIGNDISAQPTSPLFTLSPSTLISGSVIFNPSTTFTVGNIIINLTPRNQIPSNGGILISLNAMTWTRDITNTPIFSNGQLICTPVTGNVAASINCNGFSSNSSIIINSLFLTSVSSNSAVSFTINGILSPPSTQNIDQFQISTFTVIDSTTYLIDTNQVYITGLIPGSLNLTVAPVSTLVVNTPATIKFTFSLPQTINQADVFSFLFPNGTQITFSQATSSVLQIQNSASNYNSTSLTLRVSQSTLVRIYNKLTLIDISFIFYTAPPSIRPTLPIILRVLRNNYPLMTGSVSIVAQADSYSLLIAPSNTTVNTITSYALTFTLSASLTSSAIIRVSLPLTVVPASFTGNISTSNTAIPTLIGSTVIFNSISTVPVTPQTIIININGIQNPPYSGLLTALWNVSIYYTSDNADLVAIASGQSSTAITPGTILNSKISSSSQINYNANTSLTISFTISNPVPIGAYFQLSLPVQIPIQTLSTCTLFLGSIQLNSVCSLNISTITIPLTTAAQKLSNLTLTIGSIQNPSTSQPTNPFKLFSAMSSANQIDLLTDLLTYKTTTANLFKNITITRSSNQNNALATYQFYLQHYQIILSTYFVQVIFAATFIPQTNLICSQMPINQIIPCTFNNSILKLNLSNTSLGFTISKIKNPTNFKPQSVGPISTFILNYSFIISTSLPISLTNNVKSSFIGLSFAFLTRSLGSPSTLTLNFTLPNAATSLDITVPNGFTLQFPSCSSSFGLICSFNGFVTSFIGSIPTSGIINITGFSNPKTLNSSAYWIFQTFINGFSCSINTNTVIFNTFCTFPCKDCLSNILNSCTSCYTQDLSTSIYLFQSKCLMNCPAGYFANNNTFTCDICSTPCFTCSNTASNCTSCNYNSSFPYLLNNLCVKNCIGSTFPNQNTIPYVCTACPSTCLSCSSLTVCNTCINNTFLFNNSCISTCPSGTLSLNGLCTLCAPQCGSCNGLITNCTSCSNIAYNYNGSCLLSCPLGTIVSSNFCIACSSPCLTCINSTTTCTSCINSSPYLFVNTCLTSCPIYYYPNVSTCEKCSQQPINCNNCLSATMCLSCNTGFILLNNSCLSTTPPGYVNISNIATVCTQDCSTCSIIPSNCTSCKTLNLIGNTCQLNCPLGFIPINRVCTICQSPCATCLGSVSNCTSCLQSTNRYLWNGNCLLICPTKTYPNSLNLTCLSCISPCDSCTSQTVCTTCINGFNLIQSSFTCASKCPFGMTGVAGICVSCQSPCLQCSNQINNCTSCISSSYIYGSTCVTQCPSSLIADLQTKSCISCQSPCRTCQITTTFCTSCVVGYFYLLNQCLQTCLDGYYGQSSICVPCSSVCLTCSSISTCLSCTPPQILYSKTCVSACPSASARIINNTCTSCSNGCINCTAAGDCIGCNSATYLFNSSCIDSCPLNYTPSGRICITISQSANQTINSTLSASSSSVFPLPFTLVGLSLSVAMIMSKLQNHNTYFIGGIYSLWGLLEALCLAYLLFRLYYTTSTLTVWLLLIIGGGFIPVLSFIALAVQTPFLVSDKPFTKWIKSQNHHNTCFFVVISIISTIFSYKFKMICFCRLFNFDCFRARLDSVSKFRIFNIFSFIGILGQALVIYACSLLFGAQSVNSLEWMTLIDTLVVYCLNVVLAILISWKDSSFFQQNVQGVTINKVYNLDIAESLINKGFMESRQSILEGAQKDPYYTQQGFSGIEQFTQNLFVSPAKSKFILSKGLKKEAITEQQVSEDFEVDQQLGLEASPQVNCIVDLSAIGVEQDENIDTLQIVQYQLNESQQVQPSFTDSISRQPLQEPPIDPTPENLPTDAKEDIAIQTQPHFQQISMDLDSSFEQHTANNRYFNHPQSAKTHYHDNSQLKTKKSNQFESHRSQNDHKQNLPITKVESEDIVCDLVLDKQHTDSEISTYNGFSAQQTQNGILRNNQPEYEQQLRYPFENDENDQSSYDRNTKTHNRKRRKKNKMQKVNAKSELNQSQEIQAQKAINEGPYGSINQAKPMHSLNLVNINKKSEISNSKQSQLFGSQGNRIPEIEEEQLEHSGPVGQNSLADKDSDCQDEINKRPLQARSQIHFRNPHISPLKQGRSTFQPTISHSQINKKPHLQTNQSQIQNQSSNFKQQSSQGINKFPQKQQSFLKKNFAVTKLSPSKHFPSLKVNLLSKEAISENNIRPLSPKLVPFESNNRNKQSPSKNQSLRQAASGDLNQRLKYGKLFASKSISKDEISGDLMRAELNLGLNEQGSRPMSQQRWKSRKRMVSASPLGRFGIKNGAQRIETQIDNKAESINLSRPKISKPLLSAADSKKFQQIRKIYSGK